MPAEWAQELPSQTSMSRPVSASEATAAAVGAAAEGLLGRGGKEDCPEDPSLSSGPSGKKNRLFVGQVSLGMMS